MGSCHYHSYCRGQRRWLVWRYIVCTVFPLPLILAASLGATAPVYALIVANNFSNDPKLAQLQFADDDGARYFTVLKPMAEQVILLTVLDEDT